MTREERSLLKKKKDFKEIIDLTNEIVKKYLPKPKISSDMENRSPKEIVSVGSGYTPTKWIKILPGPKDTLYLEEPIPQGQGLYCWVNLKEEEVYAGESSNLPGRTLRHLNSAQNATPRTKRLYKDIKKDYEKFRLGFKRLKANESPTEQETKWIDELKAKGVSLYNERRGGGGRKPRRLEIENIPL